MNADKDLEARRSWYSAAATAYNRARPRYPVGLIESAIELAQLPPNAKVLEDVGGAIKLEHLCTFQIMEKS